MRRLALILVMVAACGSDDDSNTNVGAGGTAGSAGTVGTGGTAGAAGSVGKGGSAGSVNNGGSAGGVNTGGTAGSSAGGGGGSPGETRYFGDTHSGNMWLGPVDYAETQFHNACGPSDGLYPSGIQALYGNNLMGLSNQLSLQGLAAGQGQLCDVCAELTANGNTAIAHAITYGDETGVDDIDLSPELRTALGIGDSNYTGTWRFVTCPTSAPIQYTFDGREWTNTWWFRVWVRNSRVPVTKVEFKVGSGSWTEMGHQNDGPWETSGQDFGSAFSLRVTSLEGATIEDSIPGIGTFDPNVGIASSGNFQ